MSIPKGTRQGARRGRVKLSYFDIHDLMADIEVEHKVVVKLSVYNLEPSRLSSARVEVNAFRVIAGGEGAVSFSKTDTWPNEVSESFWGTVQRLLYELNGDLDTVELPI